MNLILGIVIGVVWGIVCAFIVWVKEIRRKKECSEDLEKAVQDFISKRYKVLFDETCRNGYNYLSVSDVREIALHFSIWQRDRMNDCRFTKEDLDMIDETIYFIKQFQRSDRCRNENDMQNSVTCEHWLNSLKSKRKMKWSKDDERIRNCAIAFLREFGDKGYENAIECIDWLEELNS